MSVPTFWGLIESAAGDQPHAPVLRDDHGRSLDRRGLLEAAERTAAGLQAHGVTSGTVVSWQLPTTIEALVLLAALARLGAVQNPLIPVLREREVGFITAQVGTQLLIVPSSWRGFDHAAMARGIAATQGCDVLEVDLSDLDRGGDLRLPAGDPATLPPAPAASPPPSGARSRRSGSAIADRNGKRTADDHEAPAAEEGGQVRWIYYSSGTTAQPKGARHTDRSVMASSGALLAGVAFTAGDVYPIAWPVSHIGGASMLTTSLLGGVELVLFDTFDPATTPERMAAHGPTLVGTAVPFFRAFLDAQKRHDEPLLPNLRAGAFGGAPVAAEVHHEMRAAFGVSLVGSWGLTEFPNATSATPDDDLAVLTTTVGRAGPGVEVRAVATDGDGVERECRVDEEGELRLKGPQCFVGYVDAALDADAFDGDGWFRTGDLGCIDAHGNVRITGRLKDIVIRNAENISVIEIEELLFRHPAVADAAVIGLPDPRTGERVCAVVALRPSATLDLASLRDHCRAEGLALHKCPEQIEIVDELPHNAMGKVLKQDLRARLLGAGAAGAPKEPV